ncbi:MAG: DnaJ C-terminal domain-containing protein [bacterium]
MPPSDDYYSILGINKNASPEEIKKAYRKLALKYHPDRNRGENAENRFKKISEAYAVLSNPQKKKQYDSFGSEGFHRRFSADDIFRGFDIDEIFKDFNLGSFAGSSGGRHYRQNGTFRGNDFLNSVGSRPVKGQDLRYEITIAFIESVLGASKTITKRSGSETREISIRIPPGITDGKSLRIKGQGSPGIMGGTAGDLFLEIRVAPHLYYWREKDDIFCRHEIPLTTAVLGGEIEVSNLVGDKKKTRIPPGSQPNTSIRLKGQGVPAHSGRAAGDLYIKLKVVLPKKLTPQQKRLFEQLKKDGI